MTPSHVLSVVVQLLNHRIILVQQSESDDESPSSSPLVHESSFSTPDILIRAPPSPPPPIPHSPSHHATRFLSYVHQAKRKDKATELASSSASFSKSSPNLNQSVSLNFITQTSSDNKNHYLQTSQSSTLDHGSPGPSNRSPLRTSAPNLYLDPGQPSSSSPSSSPRTPTRQNFRTTADLKPPDSIPALSLNPSPHFSAPVDLLTDPYQVIEFILNQLDTPV